jgi:hypothetical protein
MIEKLAKASIYSYPDDKIFAIFRKCAGSKLSPENIDDFLALFVEGCE